MITMLAASAVALTVAGCKPEAGKAGKTDAPAAAEKAPAGGEQTGKPVEKAVETGTMTFLCDKLAAEAKAASGAAFTEKVEKETRDNCRLMGMSFEKSSRGKEAVAAMVNHTIKACEGKSGKDWVSCYNLDMTAAGEAANKVIMGK